MNEIAQIELTIDEIQAVHDAVYGDVCAGQKPYIQFGLAVQAALLAKITASGPDAFMTYKGYLLHASDPKVREHSEPEPLYSLRAVYGATPAPLG